MESIFYCKKIIILPSTWQCRHFFIQDIYSVEGEIIYHIIDQIIYHISVKFYLQLFDRGEGGRGGMPCQAFTRKLPLVLRLG